jgi:hypothetical protein
MAAKARRKGDPSDAEVWGFMQVIFGEFRSTLGFYFASDPSANST